jgi:hypothetical protein
LNFFKFLLMLLFCVSVKGECLVNGSAPYYAGQKIKAFRSLDFISNSSEIISEALIEANGNFKLSIPLSTTQFIFLKIGNARIEFYANFDSKLTLNIESPDSLALVGVNQDYVVNYSLKGSNLNVNIAKLNQDIDYFYSNNYKAFMLKAAKPICDTFVPYMQKQYASIKDDFFQGVLKYRLAGLELGAYHGNKYLYDKYLKGPVNYNDRDYFDFFNEMFHHYLLQFSETPKGEDIFKVLNTNGSYEKTYELFSRDKLIENDTLRELIFIKGLMEFYFLPEYNKGNLLECIKQCTVKFKVEQNKLIASRVYERLTRFFKGNPAPDFTLFDLKNKPVSLKDYKGKVVVISFGSSNNIQYLSELSVLEKYSKKFARKVQILNIFNDEPTSEFLEVQKRNSNWKILKINNTPELMDLYGVKALPLFFIISKGGWFIEAPSENPSKWPPEKFEAFFKVE